MRNSSDIFCLKEPKYGENDGSQIFSVNGSSFSRINRRQHASSDVFQFGLPPKTEETAKMTEIPELDQSETPEPVDKELPQEEKQEAMTEKASGEPTVSSSSMKRNPVTGVGLEADEQRSSRRHCGQQSGKWMW
ncbi:uncharacterized protein LOC103313186 [Tribolium castaneum]|uniref:Uncharacterized protein n=1 Tax=Tribolium castaneum TaxID=7070 RepID=A0A139WHI3_TRICA|nr:PREDICTED: uncharacterized protein LOC103313186 [Tribolium castaneum]KYB27311.1 hypothetical protein TcasGA2_TC033189 [Tribolium castaneum]|eukprot:XP_008193993.1 PREDICTED: uncharacterized protein LOC103313186 [Tribolium castaneum]